MNPGSNASEQSDRRHFVMEAVCFGLAFLLTSIAVGAVSALFLWGLHQVTSLREAQSEWILWSPVVGLLTGLAYSYVSKSSRGGNTLLVQLLRHEPGHEPGSKNRLLEKIPLAMGPLVLLTTWLSHLAGLSVGREGTAVQMGGGVASLWGRIWRVRAARYQWLLLHAGVAAGFGSVFGVPWAGAVFAAEVAGAFRLSSTRSGHTHSGQRFARHPKAWLVALLASALADFSARFLGTTHSVYTGPHYTEFLSLHTGFYLLLAAIAFGLTAWGFLLALRVMRNAWARMINREWARPAVGGLLFTTVYFLPSTWRYLGLGTQVIAESFIKTVPVYDFLAKLAMTVFSIGTGFRGGEVTPLFFIGSTLGSALAGVGGLQPAVLASVGLVAVFGAAAGVPITCAVMAGELFGLETGLIALPVCCLASWICRHVRLYDE